MTAVKCPPRPLGLHWVEMSARHAEALEALPSLGWIDAPSPVEERAALAGELGLDAFFIKRDDRLGIESGLVGGTKLRKLDTLLAAAPWRDAPAWSSVGSIGSGHLVALTAAARRSRRRLRAHTFWVPPSPEVLEDLAFVASGPCELRFYPSRFALALGAPRALLATRDGDAAVVPPGASCPRAEAGVARGALELKRQIDAGLCPPPSHVFVPVGSGGLAVGLLAGLALAGVSCTLHGVAVVEWPVASERGLRARARRLLELLGASRDLALPALRVHRGLLGRGYGHATEASRAACARLAREGLGLEPIYSGKAVAAVVEVASELRGPVLFWLTPRARAPLPAADDWRERLPSALRRRLAEAEVAKRVTRRGAAVGATLAVVTAVVGARTCGYPDLPDGLAVLTRDAAAVLRAAIDAWIEPRPDRAAVDDVLRRIDRFLATQPAGVRRQVRAALALVEQSPLGLMGRWDRFSALERPRRVALIAALDARRGVAAEAARAARDLVMLGYYQRPESWGALGYRGPWVGPAARPDPYAVYRSDGAPPGFEASR